MYERGYEAVVIAKTGERLCSYCSAPLIRKTRERKGEFEKRRFCDRTCSSRRQTTSPTCTRCGGSGPFHKNKRRREGRCSWCCRCAGEIWKSWQKANQDKVRQTGRLYRYGITESDFSRMLSEQQGRCAICRIEMLGGTFDTTPNVDHCHQTDLVRGLLCLFCNVMIGTVFEDVCRLGKIAKYLETATDKRTCPDIRTPATRKEQSKDSCIRRKYGLRFGQLCYLLEEQQNYCKACGVRFESAVRALYPNIDHCHTSGIVRGLLCSCCNKTLGLARDRVDVLREAIVYIETFRLDEWYEVNDSDCLCQFGQGEG